MGDFPKEILLERRKRLEGTIESLEKERLRLAAHLEKHTMTPGQIRTIKDIAEKIARGVEIADRDFEARRAAIEALDISLTLTVEEGRKVVYLHWIVGPTQKSPFPPIQSQPFAFEDTTSCGGRGRTRPRPCR